MTQRIASLRRLLANPVWHALQTQHAQLAIARDGACRYPSDVAPFGAVAEPDRQNLRALHSLLLPGESIWIYDEADPSVEGLRCVERYACLQMVLPAAVGVPADIPECESLSGAHADEMVALTDIAFPGFFRHRTHVMGQYYGIRRDGELVAMGGERLMLDGYPELSGICTHPDHRGKGYATRLIWTLVRAHRMAGVTSWLHTGTSNEPAIALYRSLGFEVIQTVTLSRVERFQ
jgi:ribosomal protein S18 acetylase RimI-like enzyme